MQNTKNKPEMSDLSKCAAKNCNIRVLCDHKKKYCEDHRFYINKKCCIYNCNKFVQKKSKIYCIFHYNLIVRKSTSSNP